MTQDDEEIGTWQGFLKAHGLGNQTTQRFFSVWACGCVVGLFIIILQAKRENAELRNRCLERERAILSLTPAEQGTDRQAIQAEQRKKQFELQAERARALRDVMKA